MGSWAWRRKEADMTYELYYWPEIQGRGEFIRLALEQAGADYVDVARGRAEDGQGMPAMMRLMEAGPRPPFAPPFLRDGELLIAQTANILLYLGPRLGLAPADDAGRLWTHQLQLTMSDFLVEIHDTHHPIGGGLYYEDQKTEAVRRAADFLSERAPKHLGYLEKVLAQNPDGPAHLAGAALTYADLSAFQIIDGLRYAFPKAMDWLERACPKLVALAAAVAAEPKIAAYLASPRRIPFNQMGIFRRYPELDA
jgi:glutathione S-transferase